MGADNDAVRRIHVIYKKVLRLGVVVLLEAYWLWILFMHVVWDLPYQKVMQTGAKCLAAAAAVYLIFSAFTVRDFRSKALDKIKRMLSPEWVILLMLLVWYVLVCLIRERMDGMIYLKYNNNRIFLMMLAILLMFPFMDIMGSRRGRRYMHWMMHILTLFFSTFSAWALWKYIHLEFVTFPSGNKLENYNKIVSMMIGNNRNTTGASACFMLCICLYMFMTQNRKVGIAYIPSAIVNFMVLILTNSRSSYVSFLGMTMITVFVLGYKSQKQNDMRTRAAFGGVLATVYLSIVHYLRVAILTKYRYIPKGKMPKAMLDTVLSRNVAVARAADMAVSAGRAASSLPGRAASFVADRGGFIGKLSLAILTDKPDWNLRNFTSLNRRPEIWISSFKLMFSAPDKFFLGVTPVYVMKGLIEQGGLTRDMPDAHNGILQVGVCLGVPAMLLFIAFLVMIVRRCIRLFGANWSENYKNIWVICSVILGIMIMDVAEVRLFAIYRAVLLLFYLFAGWAVYLDIKRVQRQAK